MSSSNVCDISSEKRLFPHYENRSQLQYRQHIKVQFLLTRSRPVPIRSCRWAGSRTLQPLCLLAVFEEFIPELRVGNLYQRFGPLPDRLAVQ